MPYSATQPIVARITPRPSAASTVDPRSISRQPPDRRTVSFVVAPLIVMVVASNAAFFLWSTLVDTHPLLLLLLSAQNRYLALTTNSLDPWSYYIVGSLRLLAPDPLFYLLGLWYGVRAIDWMEHRLPSVGQSLRWAETAFTKARYLIVFVAPNNPVSLMAGAAAMPPLVFALLNIAGTITRLVIIRLLGNVFSRPLDAALGFIGDYRWFFVAGSVVLLVISTLADRRGGELGALRHLSDDLTGDDRTSGDGTSGGRTDGDRAEHDPTGAERGGRAEPDA